MVNDRNEMPSNGSSSSHNPCETIRLGNIPAEKIPQVRRFLAQAEKDEMPIEQVLWELALICGPGCISLGFCSR